MPSTDVIQFTLTLKMTTAHVAKMSVTVKNSRDHSPRQSYSTYEITPGFKPFTKCFDCTLYLA